MKQSVLLYGLFLGSGALLPAEAESEITLGIEGVTGVRSDYVHRGFQLADTSLGFQLETELVLAEETSLHLGLSHLAESGDRFFETTGYLEVRTRYGKRLTAGASMTYRDRHDSRLEGGFDLGIFTAYQINEDWRWRNRVQFDLGVEGIYAATELEWSTVLSKDSFLTVTGGLSAVSDYLDRDGLNDFYTRLALTYAISSSVSVSPYLGTSLQLSDTTDSDLLYGGLWFEVIF